MGIIENLTTKITAVFTPALGPGPRKTWLFPSRCVVVTVSARRVNEHGNHISVFYGCPIAHNLVGVTLPHGDLFLINASRVELCVCVCVCVESGGKEIELN